MTEEGPQDLTSRNVSLLQEFRRALHLEETELIGTYLFFLQVAGEGFLDRQAFFDQFTLSESKFFLLSLLKIAPHGQLTPSELAQSLAVTPGTITGLLAGLERSGYIQRREHPEDRRKASITLSPQAHALLDQVLAARFRHIQSLLSSWTPEERLLLSALLEKLHQQFVSLRPS